MPEYAPSEYLHSRVKRSLDLSITAGIGIFAVTAGAIAASTINTKGMSMLFSQLRVGQNNEQFMLYKLRTKYDDGENLPGASRVRKYGLDEIPQFTNVVSGDMSVVGYRPVQVKDLNRAVRRLRVHSSGDSTKSIDRWLSLREQSKPGITGPSQVLPLRANSSGFDHLTEVLRVESAYIEEATLLTDISIISRTFNSLRRGHNPTLSEPD
jgi:putative colanic acid biosysnthesis UDP-glucose lipid carrier transferase